jgi:hypothetical protein
MGSSFALGTRHKTARRQRRQLEVTGLSSVGVVAIIRVFSVAWGCSFAALVGARRRQRPALPTAFLKRAGSGQLAVDDKHRNPPTPRPRTVGRARL